MSTKTVGDYILSEKIGRGSFAVVYKAKHKATQNIVAIKCIALNKIPNCHKHYIDMEIKVMRDIRHPNLLYCDEFIKTDSHAFLVVEYCSLGDLHDFHQETYNNLGMPEGVVLHFLSQLASAIKYLHDQNLIHRDIKPRNILLVPSETMTFPTVKLADFGFTRSLPKTSLADSICGSPLYMAPEVLNRVAYDAKADLWSLGIVLYELMTGHVLFQVSNQLELCLNMRQYNDDVDFGVVSCRFSNELKDLVRILLKKKPSERASCDAFCYYVDLVITKDEIKDKAEISVIGSIEMRQAKSADEEDEGEEDDEDEFVVIDCNEIMPMQEPKLLQRRHSSPEEQRRQQQQKIQVPRLRTLSHGTSKTAKAMSSIAPMTLFDEDDDTKASCVLSSTSTVVGQTVYFETMETPLQFNQLLGDLKQTNDMAKSIMTYADEKYSLFEKDPRNQVLAEQSLCLASKISILLRLAIQKSKKQYEDFLISKDQDLDLKLEVIESFIWMNDMLKLYTQRILQLPTLTNTTCSIENLLYIRAIDMSKEASVMQLIGEELEDCISKYTHSIHLLKAIVIEPTKNILMTKDMDIIEKMINKLSQKIQQVETNMKIKKLKQQKHSSSISLLTEQVEHLHL